MEALIGNAIERKLLDKGYRGHKFRPEYKLRCSSQARTGGISTVQARPASALRRQAGYQPTQIRAPDGPQLPLDSQGEAINAVPAAAGYNFRSLISWLRAYCSKFSSAHCSTSVQPTQKIRAVRMEYELLAGHRTRRGSPTISSGPGPGRTAGALDRPSPISWARSTRRSSRRPLQCAAGLSAYLWKSRLGSCQHLLEL